MTEPIHVANCSGFFGDRGADNLSLDAQAKGLGEFVRARRLDIPEELLTCWSTPPW